MRIIAAAFLLLPCAGCGTAIEDSQLSPVSDQASIATVAPSRQQMRDLTTEEKATLADGFASTLDNPEAAQFRWAKVPKFVSDANGSFEYCGLVNVKNSNGGYNGMQPFLATITIANGKITGGTIAAIDALPDRWRRLRRGGRKNN